jgi:hypothetical protein
MTTILIGAVGLFTVLAALRALARTFRQGTFRSRGHRLLRRKNHPVIFWANAARISILAAIGLALMGWAVSRLG